MVLERYIGPAFTEPSTISRYEENADHPFNKAENWAPIPYKASGELVAGKLIEFNFEPVQAPAIRARMTRKSTTNGLAVVEFTAYSAGKGAEVETLSATISIDGKSLENFDPNVTEYTLTTMGTKPKVTATTSGHGVVTVVDHGNTNLPTLVRLVSKDGNLVKEYRLHFKSTFQTTPTEGVKNLVAEVPSLEIEKTPLPFKEVIRETPELAQGQRRIVSEGQDGEKVDYIQVLGTTRTLVHSEQRKAQDRIIEVGVKPSISNSKGEEPAPVNEVPEFKGGANFVEAAVNEVPEFKGGANFVEAAVNEVPAFKGGANFVEAAVSEVPEYTGILATVGDQVVPSVEKPEFKGGVNAVMALEHKLPEYRGILATVGNQPAPTVEKPEFKLSSLEKAQTPEVPVQVVKEDKRLPETGEKQSETAIFLAGVTLALSAALLTAKRKED
ncbi:Beta-galactosidase [Streptococcus mitis]|uniref:Beta-galactosidase n=2 Tax=Streptococcus mitis TaxID=28037 RepID=A0A150NPN7_STRMT|nr:Beta-galactosidase [Streptococcus mitis]